MVNFEMKSHYDYEDLLRVVHILRSPGGCPWDQEQTHKSIRRDLLEETYEAAEAIDTGDTALLRRNWAMCCCRWCSTPTSSPMPDGLRWPTWWTR